jgi:hypothetical protein
METISLLAIPLGKISRGKEIQIMAYDVVVPAIVDEFRIISSVNEFTEFAFSC